MNEIWVTTRSLDRAKHGGHLFDDADSIPPYKKAFPRAFFWLCAPAVCSFPSTDKRRMTAMSEPTPWKPEVTVSEPKTFSRSTGNHWFPHTMFKANGMIYLGFSAGSDDPDR